MQATNNGNFQEGPPKRAFTENKHECTHTVFPSLNRPYSLSPSLTQTLARTYRCAHNALHAHTVALRMQATNNGNFKESPPKRAFADYIFCMAILHLWVMNFMG